MNKKSKLEAVFFYGVFICYLLLLIKILFLSRVSLSELFNDHRTAFASFNLIPFQSIMQYMSGSTETLRRFAFGNVVGNVIIFIPLGIYLPLIKKDKRILVSLLFIFIVSLSVEIIQGILALGAADIDDIILNFLGGFIGVLGVKLFLFLLHDEKKAHTTITILSSIIGLPVILYYLFMVKMRF